MELYKDNISNLLKVLTYWVASTKLINYQVVNTQWGHLPKIIALVESLYMIPEPKQGLPACPRHGPFPIVGSARRTA